MSWQKELHLDAKDMAILRELDKDYRKSFSNIGKKVGLTVDQVLEIRRGRATLDDKLDALAQFVHAVVEFRGAPSTWVDTWALVATVSAFLAAATGQSALEAARVVDQVGSCHKAVVDTHHRL